MELPMHTPVDPWGAPIEPDQPPPPLMYGRASVPPAPVWHPTSELPEVGPAPRRRERIDPREIGRRAMSGKADRERVDGPKPPMPNVSWIRSRPASRRMLFDGWGFTAAGLLVLFCGWGVWAVAGGNASSVPPVVSLLFVIGVGAIVFAVPRLSSRVLIERMRGQRRRHARWAHFITGVFLAGVGVSYLLHNAWLVDGLGWLKDQWQHL
jgi:hypothetical protein